MARTARPPPAAPDPCRHLLLTMPCRLSMVARATLVADLTLSFAGDPAAMRGTRRPSSAKRWPRPRTCARWELPAGSHGWLQHLRSKRGYTSIACRAPLPTTSATLHPLHTPRYACWTWTTGCLCRFATMLWACRTRACPRASRGASTRCSRCRCGPLARCEAGAELGAAVRGVAVGLGTGSCAGPLGCLSPCG